jgi:hypothetical protein
VFAGIHAPALVYINRIKQQRGITMSIHYTNSNSHQKQFIERMIKQEVLACQSQLVETLLKTGDYAEESLICYGDIQNDYTTVEELSDFDHQQLKNDCEEFESEPKEILEWWLVTDYLAEKLNKINEPVLKSDFGNWWGRTCSGQAIECDPTFWEIFQYSVNSLTEKEG